MKYEVTYTHTTTYLVDDSRDTIVAVDSGGELDAITPEGGSLDFADELPEWLAHEWTNGRLGEMVRSAVEFGCEQRDDNVLDNTCPECNHYESECECVDSEAAAPR